MDIQNIYNSIAELSREIVRECTARSVKISTAESCTGGMISGAVTSISGSSAVIELGVCSYSNRIKHEILHVPAEVLERFTEYSVECAAEMAKGVMELSGADYGVSTTGVAGPTGGSAEHPVGLDDLEGVGAAAASASSLHRAAQTGSLSVRLRRKRRFQCCSAR